MHGCAACCARVRRPTWLQCAACTSTTLCAYTCSGIRRGGHGRSPWQASNNTARVARGHGTDLSPFSRARPCLQVKTGSVPYASTTADISIVLVGSNGATKELTLSNKRTNFAQGQVRRGWGVAGAAA